MKNLLEFEKVIYDSMIIIYYCFKIKNHNLIEFSEKAHELTQILLKNNIKITVPSFLISEIQRKDTLDMIESYISSNQIANIPKIITPTFKLGLDFKFKRKLDKLLKKEWFNVEDYLPPNKLYQPIENFFKNLIYRPDCKEFLKKKNRLNPIPSFEDLGLMTFSKDKKCPIF